MPLNGRNLYNLIALQPGVTGMGISSTFGAGGNGNDSFSGESAPRINAITAPEEIRSYVCVPIVVKGDVFGVFSVNYFAPQSYSEEDLRPHEATHGAWHCRSCARVFSLKLLGLAVSR